MNSAIFDRFKWYILSFLIGLTAGVFASYFFGPLRTEHHFTERVIEREIPVVREVVKQVNQTEVVYVPKAAVSEERLDPVSGKITTIVHKEMTDVDVQIEKPKVNVKLNSQPYSFSLLEGESQKFDQGKISLRQESSIGIELAIKPHVVDRTKNGGIDLFVGRYCGIGIQHQRLGLDIGTNGRDNDFRLRWRAIEW